MNNKLGYIHPMEYRIAIRINEIHLHITLWIDLTSILLSKRSHTQEYLLYESIYVRNKNRQNESMLLEVRIVVALGTRWRLEVTTSVNSLS